jgi:hypothetical protein
MRIGRVAGVIVVALVSIAAVFFDARLEPPAGRVISGWGQLSSAWDFGQPAGKSDAGDLAAYEKAVAPHPPAMISFDVGPDFTIVSGFLNHYREFAAARGFFVAQVAINFRGLEHDVSIGMRDPDLMVLADGLHEVGRPVLVRIGSEFNHPGTRYEPSAYIGAFRHATDIMRKAHMNSAMVWDATAQGFSTSQYMKWYPGDDVVDWWGIDVSEREDFSSAASKAFVDDAAHHHKPVVISANSPGAKSEAEALARYAGIFDFIRANPAVKAFSLRWPSGRLARWPKVAAYVKQQLADARFIDATEAPAIFRPPRDAQ